MGRIDLDAAITTELAARHTRGRQRAQREYRICLRYVMAPLTTLSQQTSVEVPSAPFVAGLPPYAGSFQQASTAQVGSDGAFNQARQFFPDAVTAAMGVDRNIYFDPSTTTVLQYLPLSTGYAQGEYMPTHQPTASPNRHTIYNPSPGPHSSYLPYHSMIDHRRGIPFSDGLTDDVPTWMAPKRQIYDGCDEGPSTEQCQHSLGTTDEGDRPLPGGGRGLVAPTAASPDGGQQSDKTLANTNRLYKTFALEDGILRERQGLAGIPSAEPGSSTQQSPNRPAKHGRDVAARRQPRVAGNSGSKTNNGASSSSTSVACIWPVCTAPNSKPCPWTFAQSQNMLQHVRKEHLRVAIRCPHCGTYITQRLRAHQETSICRLLVEGNDLEWERRARNALQRTEAMGIVNGRELSDGVVRELVNALRPLIHADRSRPKDIVDDIDAWMREDSGAEWGWQRSTDIVWTWPTAHKFPS